jgi:DNA polymerase I
LMGDAVDNAPGVPGVGEITAKKLVAAHGDVEDVLAQGPKTASPKIAKALVEHADRARLTKRLVVIKTDIDDLPSTASLRYEGPRREEAEEFFRSMEFRTLSEAFAPPRRASRRRRSSTGSSRRLKPRTWSPSTPKRRRSSRSRRRSSA